MAETDPQPASVTPYTRFDWSLYSDATFAGLAILIPVPGLDWLFEQYFRRRMPDAIAKRNGRELHFKITRELNRSAPTSCQGCLLIPLTGLFWFLKRTFRTMFYVLTVKEAADLLGLYWHRAFLLDYIMRRGDLATLESTQIAHRALQQLLATTTTSPLTQLAKQVIGNSRHAFRTIWRWVRRHKEDESVQTTRQQMATAWQDFDAYLYDVARQYDEAHQQATLWFQEQAARKTAGEKASQGDNHI